jgi:outer membrane protein assembly factor BamB
MKGGILWKVSFSDLISVPIVANGIVYVAVGGSSVLAYKAATGDLLWTQSLPSPTYPYDPVVGGVLVYVITDGNLYALDAATGNRRWVSQGGVGDEAVVDEWST